MRILIVNRINNRSVGTIAKKIGSLAEERLNAEIFYFWGEFDGSFLHSNEFIVKRKNRTLINRIRLVDLWYKKRTGSKQLINCIRKLNPSLIHLHCIHGGFFDFKILFKFLVKKQIPIIITAHDCWYVTGGCSHFISNKCEKWKNGSNCKGCLKNRFFHKFFLEKKKLLPLANIKAIVCCSYFVEKVYKESILCSKNIITIHNGVNLQIFNNIKNDLDINVFKKYRIPFSNNYLIFVSAFWHITKGSEYVSQLSIDLENEYNVLIIGKGFDKPVGISTFIINSIDNQKELSTLYRYSLLFVNPTLEDNYPTTTLEATSSGVKTVVFDVGGCKEAIYEENGVLVSDTSYLSILQSIREMLLTNTDSSAVRKVALDNFDDKICYKEYIDLYGR